MSNATALWLATPRCYVVPTPMRALARSHAGGEYHDIPLSDDGSTATVHFPPEWPGDPSLDWIAHAERWRTSGRTPWIATVVDRDALEAIGQVGCPAPPTPEGTIEVRYATNPSVRDRGIATEAGGAFVRWLLTQPTVARVIAECLVTNAASVRVLEKVGFVPQEEWEDEGGRLLRWVRERH